MKIIVAMDSNRGIGYKGQIPWHIPSDLKWFKEVTSNKNTGGILVMGRTTYDKVGLLPNRFTYVLTNDPTKLELPRTYQCMYITLEKLLSYTLEFSKMWVVGGAKTYEAMFPYCNEIFVTHIMDEFECDTFMPEFETQFPHSGIVRESTDNWIVRYWK